MYKFLLSLLILSTLFVGCGMEEEEEALLAKSNGTSCSIDMTVQGITVTTCGESESMSSSFCDQLISASNTSAQEIGGVATGSFSSSVCATENSFGQCSLDGLLTRSYTGTASDQESNCDGTWVADSSLVYNSTKQVFCEYQDKCINLEKVSVENAENFCNQLNGYLVDSCQ